VTRLEHDWYPAAVPDNVEWGEGSWIYSSYGFRHFLSAARPAVSIGRNTGIYHPAHFDLGPEGYVRIGDNSTLLSVIICSNGSIQIGDLALIAHGVVIADDPVAVPGPRRVGARITLGGGQRDSAGWGRYRRRLGRGGRLGHRLRSARRPPGSRQSGPARSVALLR
jgi:acetyltransferase-like isoleucine patch superfamily enzyme